MKLTNLFGILSISICLLCCMSCSDPVEDEIPQEKHYELSSIRWKLEEGDGQEIVEKEVPEQVFRNEGNTPMPLCLYPLEGIDDMSCFYSDNEEEFAALTQQGIEVILPREIELLSTTEYKYMGSGIKAPFQLKEVALAAATTLKDSTDVAPHCELRYKATVSQKRITATYYARFVDESSFDSYELKGKWVGLFFNGIHTETTLDEIK